MNWFLLSRSLTLSVLRKCVSVSAKCKLNLWFVRCFALCFRALSSSSSVCGLQRKSHEFMLIISFLSVCLSVWVLILHFIRQWRRMKELGSWITKTNDDDDDEKNRNKFYVIYVAVDLCFSLPTQHTPSPHRSAWLFIKWHRKQRTDEKKSCPRTEADWIKLHK